MHNRFESLLRRCRARKRKILMKRMALATLFAAAAAAALYLTGREGTLFGLERGEEVSAVPAERAEATVRPAVNRADSTAESAKSTAVSEDLQGRPGHNEPKPSRKMEDSGEKTAAPAKPVKVVRAEETSSEVTEKRATKRPPEKEVILLNPPEKRKVVLEVKEVADIEALKERYANSPGYEVALKIAESYYDEGDFENASVWARKANLLDRDDERAWLIYAKSEYALGREERAKRILRLYLDYKESPAARSLLITWSGE
ncbi:transformation system protein [Hydrogenimonas sp.]|nr:transformation system protein [Hydrogenimonas sp.]